VPLDVRVNASPEAGLEFEVDPLPVTSTVTAPRAADVTSIRTAMIVATRLLRINALSVST